MIEYIDVQTFYNRSKERLKLTLATSENGFSRRVTKSDIHRPGLALAGFVVQVTKYLVIYCSQLNAEIFAYSALSIQQRH